MQISKTNRRNLIIGGALLTAVTPSFALFGVGSIVFDPTSYAQLISQATTVMNQFKIMRANVTHFSLKNAWATTEMHLKNTNVRNLFGETNGFSIAINTNSPAPLPSWPVPVCMGNIDSNRNRKYCPVSAWAGSV